MIPKKLHIIWVGNECWTRNTHLGPVKRVDKRPETFIETWKDKHSSWDVKVWGNSDLASHEWRLKDQIFWLYSLYNYPGVADLMRYEILYEQGGVYVDADTICLQPLDDLLECEAFAVRDRNNIISNGFIGAVKEYSLFDWMIDQLLERGDDCLCWRGKKGSTATAIGPGFFTYAIGKTNPNITILPYYTFMPNDPFIDSHYVPTGNQKIYADHVWHSYLGSEEREFQ